MSTTPTYKRRTFADVAAAAYADGWDKGREQARKEFEMAYQLLSKSHSDTLAELELALARQQRANVSLSKLAWSRLTGLFKRESKHGDL